MTISSARLPPTTCLPTFAAWMMLVSVAITMFGCVFNSLAVMTGLSTISLQLNF
jgi:hypothetical protein